MGRPRPRPCPFPPPALPPARPRPFRRRAMCPPPLAPENQPATAHGPAIGHAPAEAMLEAELEAVSPAIRRTPSPTPLPRPSPCPRPCPFRRPGMSGRVRPWKASHRPPTGRQSTTRMRGSPFARLAPDSIGRRDPRPSRARQPKFHSHVSGDFRGEVLRAMVFSESIPRARPAWAGVLALAQAGVGRPLYYPRKRPETLAMRVTLVGA